VFLGEWEGGEFRRRVIDQDPIALAMFEAGRWDVIPGAEPDDDFRERVRRGIERIAAAHPDELVVAVVHGGVIGQAMNIASNASGFGFSGADNASISHLVITPARWIIRCFNDTAHLSERFSTVDDPPPATGIRPNGVTF
jgi:probable phosphoglycerate mutase